MTLQEYQKDFEDNLIVMSRTAAGVLDVSASSTKSDSMLVTDGDEARSIVELNAGNAVDFLYQNRERNFESAKELADFIIELALIANDGIVKKERLFRNGADSVKYNYTRIKDIPKAWEWFTDTLFWMLKSDTYEIYEVAAFSELIINSRAHFFSDGCGKISMLIGLYIFMRHDLPGAKYISRKEFFKFVNSREVYDPDKLKHILTQSETYNFFQYYGSLCRASFSDLNMYYETVNDGKYVIHLKGAVTKGTFLTFETLMDDFYEDHEGAEVVVDLKKLLSICSNGSKYLAGMEAKGRKLSFINAGYECGISLQIEGLGPMIEGLHSLKTIDASECRLLGEGANGKIYRINDELIAKTYKRDGYYDDMMHERELLRDALIVGVAAPISYGYALIEGRVALLMEFINSSSLLEILKSEDSWSPGLVRQYVDLVTGVHNKIIKTNPNLLQHEAYENSVMDKADKLDPLIKPEYRGVARRLLEEIDEPEGLIHGDIHPGNVMFSGKRMIFIDFDSFGIDKPIYDLGGLYHVLLLDYMFTEDADKTLLKFPKEKAERFWNEVIAEIYENVPQDEIERKIKYIKLIAIIRHTHIMRKNKCSDEDLNKCIEMYEQCIEELL